MSDRLQLTRGMTAEERFWFYVDVTPVCWLWTGRITLYGYGQLWTGERRVFAHRYCYELLVGPIPNGLTLDHLCRVKACVNPDHLQPLDNIANIMRGYGIPARNSRKSICSHGHPFSPENTYIRPNGQRTCKTCSRAHQRRYKQRQTSGEFTCEECGRSFGTKQGRSLHYTHVHRLTVWDAARPLPAAEYGRGVDTVPDPAGLLSEATA